MRANRWQKLLSKSFTRSAHSINEKNVEQKATKDSKEGDAGSAERWLGGASAPAVIKLHRPQGWQLHAPELLQLLKSCLLLPTARWILPLISGISEGDWGISE
jgi:hypothetical protein